MHLNKKFSEDNRGFTLLELVVTVVILALVVAPFLSSFVTASKTNVKSKRIQEANELSQYIIEQFKATSVDELKNVYRLTEDSSYRIDGTAGSGYGKTTKRYMGTVSSNITDAALPAGFSDNYKAEITMTPTKTIVNSDEAIPVIDRLDKEYCAVFAQNIYKYDSSYPSAIKRGVEVNIDYEPSVLDPNRVYKVTLSVEYFDISNGSLGTRTAVWYFQTVPSVYILYKPLSTSGTDTIKIKNNLVGTQLISPGATDESRVNVYIVNQKSSSLLQPVTPPSADNVTIVEKEASGAENSYVLNDLVDVTRTDTLEHTILYTNIASGDDKNDTVNGTVQMIKIDTVYQIDVAISYAGKEISEFTATKTIGN